MPPPMEFIDVPGASGARYRFRRSTVAGLPATAGNLIAVTGPPSGRRYLVCGSARSLNGAGLGIEAALGETREAELYIQLNVARTVREAEYADIVAAVCPETHLPDLG
jgi:hypothetical protein